MSKITADLQKGNTAIVLIEYQNDFTSEGGALYEAVKPCMEKTDMLKKTKEIVDLARESGVKVIHVPIMFGKNYYEIQTKFGILANIKGGKTFTKGKWNSEIYEPLKPKDDEIVIEGKKGLCGFCSTNLDFVLRQNKIENVVLCGFLTNCCVESTMRTAYEKGYSVVTVTDLSSATSVEAHENTFKNNFPMFSEIITSTDLAEKIKLMK